MSVPKSERSESTTQYIYGARELYKYTIQKCAGFPKRYTFYVSQPIADLANKIYEDTVRANSVFPTNQHEAQLRYDNLISAIANCYALLSKIEIASEIFEIDSQKKEYWAQLIRTEIGALKGSLKYDRGRFKTLKN